MATPYIGEIRMFAGTFAPFDWAFCEGQQVRISDYQALYTLIGTTYGGDAIQTFNLPDLRGRLPIHAGQSAASVYSLGDKLGTETVTLAPPHLAAHSHTVMGASAAGAESPSGKTYGGGTTAVAMYVATAPGTNMAATMVQQNPAGGQAHNNLMPYLPIRFIIALAGVFPVRS